jgi:serine/threonine protein kinase/Leucine-rich repeat (LRR) protein
VSYDSSQDKTRLRKAVSQVPPATVLAAEAKDDLVGTVYLGKYEVQSVIGAGGMGVIYLGRQIFLDRPVAIKLLKDQHATTQARARFHHEAKAASALKHPGIVSILDFGVDELDLPYMVMEHVDGSTLSDLLRERVTLSVEEILPISLAICDALSEAHKKGIVHRDLKPTNIMLVVDEGGAVHTKILDFGVAKMLDVEDRTYQDLTKAGVVLGSPLYMSPEQILSKNVTNRSDLYSLGCTLYACLTGAPPFSGENPMTTMDMQCAQKPRSLKEASGGMDFPPGLESIVMRLLEKNPDDRYGSASQLKGALIEMALQNGLMDQSADLPTAGRRQNLDGAIAQMSTPMSGTVQNGQEHANSPTSQTIQSPLSTLGKSDQSTRDSGITLQELHADEKEQLFWKADLPDKKIAAHADKFKKLPPRKEFAHESSSEPAHDTSARKMVVVALALLGFVCLVAGGFAFYFTSRQATPVKQAHNATSDKSANSFQSEPLESLDPLEALDPTEDADSCIEQMQRAGAVNKALNVKNQAGLTEKGLSALSTFKSLEDLDLSATHLTDSGVKYLVSCPLIILRLSHNHNISDVSLSDLAKMKKLQSLVLNDTGVTSDGLSYLATSSSLQRLSLVDNRTISDSGIRKLLPIKDHLYCLHIGGCGVTDTGRENLAKFDHLVRLDLGDNPGISDRTLQAMQGKLINLEALSVAKDHIGDAGVHALTSFKKLNLLDLSFIKLSRAAQADVASMKGLTHLYLEGCALTPAELQTLRQALPSTKIEVAPPFD